MSSYPSVFDNSFAGGSNLGWKFLLSALRDIVLCSPGFYSAGKETRKCNVGREGEDTELKRKALVAASLCSTKLRD